MHRQPLLKLLEAYRGSDAHEEASRQRTLAFVREHPDCFERSLTIGHITGADWLLDVTGTRVLLTHHKKLGKWLQLGGHADGNPDVLDVALTEAREESGLDNIVPLSPAIFDVDVHRIPATGDVPEHDHYDIRFLLQASEGAAFRVSDESFNLAWVPLRAVPDLVVDPSVLRMNEKWLQRTQQPVK